MSTSSSSSHSSSLQKKTQNKVYTKEMMCLIEKIIRSKKNTFRLTKTQSSNLNNQNNVSKGHSNQLEHSGNKETTEIKTGKTAKHNHNKNPNHSSSSSMNEAVSVSMIINTTFSKVNDFNKQLTEYLKNYNNNREKCSNLIIEILKYLKQENNLSSLIYDNEHFIQNILDLFSLINFSSVKNAPKYKITDINYNSIDGVLSKAVIEDFAMNINESELNGGGSTMIRIKNEFWKDILNMYDILITLLNNIPTLSIMISKISIDFISSLVLSLNTLDNEERVLIKILIYKIYISSLTYRSYILKSISNIIIDISNDEKNKLLCLSECLDLLNCILLGTKKPINEKYLKIVNDVICPLLKCKNVFKQAVLKETLIKLMNYDKKMLNLILGYLLKTWPVRYPERVIIYLDIIESLFNNNNNTGNIEERSDSTSLNNAKMLKDVDERILKTLLNKIKCCFSDLSFLIADRSLVFFKNEIFIQLLYKLNLQKSFILKIIENIQNHWSQEIKIISRIVISKLMKRDEKISGILTAKEKKVIDDFKFDMNESEDIWDIQFNLKGD